MSDHDISAIANKLTGIALDDTQDESIYLDAVNNGKSRWLTAIHDNLKMMNHDGFYSPQRATMMLYAMVCT